MADYRRIIVDGSSEVVKSFSVLSLEAAVSLLDIDVATAEFYLPSLGVRLQFAGILGLPKAVFRKVAPSTARMLGIAPPLSLAFIGSAKATKRNSAGIFHGTFDNAT